MGIAERKQKEKETIKNKILEKANQLFLEKGYEGTSIRTISDAIEYSPATIYLYFKDKNDIFIQLQNKAFDLLYEKLDATKNITQPFERLLAVGKVYLNFAFDYPQYYDLMFIDNCHLQAFKDGTIAWKRGYQLYKTIEEIVEACIVAKQIKGEDCKVVAFMFWSYIHGQCALLIRKRLNIDDKQTLKYLISNSFEFVTNLLKKE